MTLPKHLKTTDLKWLSVWCRLFKFNFGEVFFPDGLALPGSNADTAETRTDFESATSPVQLANKLQSPTEYGVDFKSTAEEDSVMLSNSTIEFGTDSTSTSEESGTDSKSTSEESGTDSKFEKKALPDPGAESVLYSKPTTEKSGTKSQSEEESLPESGLDSEFPPKYEFDSIPQPLFKSDSKAREDFSPPPVPPNNAHSPQHRDKVSL